MAALLKQTSSGCIGMKNLLAFKIQLHSKAQQGSHGQAGAKNVAAEYLFSSQHALTSINQIAGRNQPDIHRAPKRQPQLGRQVIDFLRWQRFSRLQEKKINIVASELGLSFGRPVD